MTAPTTMQIPGFRGDVIAPGQDGYDDARAVWNGAVDRRPRLIARCGGTANTGRSNARWRGWEITVAWWCAMNANSTSTKPSSMSPACSSPSATYETTSRHQLCGELG